MKRSPKISAETHEVYASNLAAVRASGIACGRRASAEEVQRREGLVEFGILLGLSWGQIGQMAGIRPSSVAKYARRVRTRWLATMRAAAASGILREARVLLDAIDSAQLETPRTRRQRKAAARPHEHANGAHMGAE